MGANSIKSMLRKNQKGLSGAPTMEIDGRGWQSVSSRFRGRNLSRSIVVNERVSMKGQIQNGNLGYGLNSIAKRISACFE